MIKQLLRKNTPKSSILFQLSTNYKKWCIKFLHRCNYSVSYSFCQIGFGLSKHCSRVQKNSPAEHNTSCISCSFNNEQYCVSERKLVMSGDIELNPGPVQKNRYSTDIPVVLLSHSLLEVRLHQFQLRPLDVGGGGDCFFRVVSQQLYGDLSHHLDIRAAGIAYMRDNPERFIERNTDYSRGQYLNSMSMQGTWCDGLIIQAVADQLNLRIVIAESNEHFAEYNIIRAVTPLQQPTDIYLGHLGEYHYLSTVPCATTTDPDLLHQLNKTITPTSPNKNVKENRNAYMRKYRKRN